MSLSVCLSACLPVCLSVSVYLPACVCVYLCISVYLLLCVHPSFYEHLSPVIFIATAKANIAVIICDIAVIVFVHLEICYL